MFQGSTVKFFCFRVFSWVQFIAKTQGVSFAPRQLGLNRFPVSFFLTFRKMAKRTKKVGITGKYGTRSLARNS